MHTVTCREKNIINILIISHNGYNSLVMSFICKCYYCIPTTTIIANMRVRGIFTVALPPVRGLLRPDTQLNGTTDETFPLTADERSCT